jgi:hypothetical protein
MMLKSKDQQVEKKILLEPDDVDMTNQTMHVNGELLVRYKFRYVCFRILIRASEKDGD